jgi:Amt family ammonium transporter
MLCGMEISSGDTAWVLTSAAMVLLMTPGLALFYGGMVRAKSVLAMMMMSFGAMATVGVAWVLWGYSEAFGESWHGLVGNPFAHFGLSGLMAADSVVGTIPTLAFVAFQAVFAVITVALISGAIAERAKFVTWLVFTVVWATVVYFPVAHWVFAFDGLAADRGGWIANQLHAIDFAGGTAVHINAGAAGLALALVLGRRIDLGRRTIRPHNLTMVMLGTGLLWFGWFGFNAGSALGANGVAALAFVNTIAATGAGLLGWLVTEGLRDGRGSSLGAASGVVAGLVAITPAANSVTPVGAIGLGLVAGAVCAAAVGLKHRLGVDDSLDVVGVHLVGGLVGTVGIGFLASSAAPAGVDGLLYGGGPAQLARQAVAALAVVAFSFTATYAIGTVLHRTLGLRIGPEAELAGADRDQHGEAAYDLARLAGAAWEASLPEQPAPVPAPAHEQVDEPAYERVGEGVAS